MTLTPKERDILSQDHPFLEGLHDSLIESNVVGERVVDIEPGEVFLKRLLPDEDSQGFPFLRSQIKIPGDVDFLDRETWGVLQPYTLLNELRSEYAMIFGYLRKIGEDTSWLDYPCEDENYPPPNLNRAATQLHYSNQSETWRKAERLLTTLYRAEVDFIGFMMNGEHKFPHLAQILRKVELIHQILPIEISQYGLGRRSVRLSKALAKEMGLSHPMRLSPPPASRFNWEKFFHASTVFGHSSYWVDSYWDGTNTMITALSDEGNSRLMDEIIKEIAEKTETDKTIVMSHFQNVNHTQVVQAFEPFLEEHYKIMIEEAYNKTLVYFDQVKQEVDELARMHWLAVKKAAQEEARKKRQAEEKARKEKEIAEEKARKEKERARLALIRENQAHLLEKCKESAMAHGFVNVLETQLKNSEFTCSWEDLLHQVWIPLGRPKISNGWHIGLAWALTSFSWTKSVEDLQQHIETAMSSAVNPLISDQSELLGLLPSDVSTFERVVNFLEEKEFFNLQQETLVDFLALPEQEFQHLKTVLIQLFDSSQDISSIDRILGRLLAGEDEAFVLADEGVAFQT